MSPLLFWLIVLNIFLLGGVLALSYLLRGKREKWQLQSDAQANASAESRSSARDIRGLLGATESDLDSMEMKMDTLERDVDGRVTYRTLSRDMTDLRQSFVNFSADVREELNFLRTEILRHASQSSVSWSSSTEGETAVLVRSSSRKKR